MPTESIAPFWSISVQDKKKDKKVKQSLVFSSILIEKIFFKCLGLVYWSDGNLQIEIVHRLYGKLQLQFDEAAWELYSQDFGTQFVLFGISQRTRDDSSSDKEHPQLDETEDHTHFPSFSFRNYLV